MICYAVDKKTKKHTEVGQSLALMFCFSPDVDVLQADADGWIKWEGGDCPVADEARVEIKYMDGKIENFAHGCSYRWDIAGHHYDIIAYRPILDTTTPEEEEEFKAMDKRLNGEWDGTGAPPAGTLCEWSDFIGPHKRALVMGYYENSVWLRVFNSDAKGDHYPVTVNFVPGAFRPIPTPEDDVVDKLVALMVDYYGNPKGSESYIGLSRAIYRAIKSGDLTL